MTVAMIYALAHPETGTVRYIGKTSSDLTSRLRGHLADARRCGANGHRINWIRSLPAAPVILPMCVTEECYASAAERFAIALYRAAGENLVNETDGGDGTPGRRHSPEACAKMSATRRGKKLSVEHRAAIGASHLNKLHSPEHRAKIGAANRGKKYPPCSPETRVKLSDARRRRQKQPFSGRRHTPETLAKMRTTQRARFEAKKSRG